MKIGKQIFGHMVVGYFYLKLCFFPALHKTQNLLQSRQKSIIVILADDIGFSDIGCYDGEIPTPNIDMLANNGVQLIDFTTIHVDAQQEHHF